ncbi:uncharacterized protein LOC116344701 [Contarinia nasturtii]|uniref:uncharacterized protein LOC116344701 n=1 Tax=Contarinia nasturtii TaxID=265458 RepID=UPI0012D3F3C6|nr:uncharacterized protein LOC116344701 [Contarinia nasturtii]
MSSTDIVNAIMSTIKLVNNPATKQTIDSSAIIESGFFAKVSESLYLNTKINDFHFVFDSSDRIPVHELLLSAGSEVFKTMFGGLWKGQKEIKITDESSAVYKEFLQFFYLKQVKLTKENAAKVMLLCKKHDMDECAVVCGKFLKSIIDDDNVCYLYGLAISCGNEELKKFCEMIIGFNSQAVFASDSFKDCSRDVLSEILDMNETLCCPEIELFEACMTWVKTASKRKYLTGKIVKAYMGDLFYKIRFGSMPFKDIGNIMVEYTELFTPDEFKIILQKTVPGEFHSYNFCNSRQIPTKPILCQRNQDVVHCNRNHTSINVDATDFVIKNIETTTFSSDKPLIFSAFGCSYLGDKELVIPTEITIFEINTFDLSEKIVLEKENTILKPFITLSKLIFIKPKCLYRIIMKQTPPPNTSYSIKKYRKMNTKMDGRDINMEFHDRVECEDDNGKYGISIIDTMQFININGNIEDATARK